MTDKNKLEILEGVLRMAAALMTQVADGEASIGLKLYVHPQETHSLIAQTAAQTTTRKHGSHSAVEWYEVIDDERYTDRPYKADDTISLTVFSKATSKHRGGNNG